MQAPRLLLLPVDDSERMATRFAVAVQVADRFDARIDAHYAGVPSLVSSSAFGDGVSASIAAEMAVRLDQERQGSVRAAFDQAHERSPRLHWIDVEGDPLDSLRRQARCADLMILGQADPSAGMFSDQPPSLVADLLARSGRPALVLPFTGTIDSVGQRVVVAWKPTAESARALAAAVPWMQGAAAIDLISFGADAALELEPVVRYLERHGIRAAAHPWTQDERDVGELLLSEVADRGADLLVMGCYGHTRLKERLLGGVTRTILSSMTVPVLMAH